MQSEARPIGIGIAGLGRFGKFLLAAYTEVKEVKVVAVCDVNRKQAQALAPRDARIYEQFVHMLEDPNVAAVVIATPPYLHAPMALQAVCAGKHVLVEKPLALTLEDAKAVVEAARKNGVLLTVDYVLRFHPLHQVVMRVVREKILGDLEFFSLVNLATDEGLDPHHWFWDTTKSGGIHIEHGVHFFDLCNHLVGFPPSLVQGYVFFRSNGRIDRAAAVVRYGQKIFASFYHSFNRPRCVEQATIHLCLSRGEIIIEGWIPVRLTLYGLVAPTDLEVLQQVLGQRPKILGIHDQWVQIQAEITRPARQEEYKRALQALMRDFVRAILGEGTLTITAEDALTSLAVAIQAQQSAVL